MMTRASKGAGTVSHLAGHLLNFAMGFSKVGACLNVCERSWQWADIGSRCMRNKNVMPTRLPSTKLNRHIRVFQPRPLRIIRTVHGGIQHLC